LKLLILLIFSLSSTCALAIGGKGPLEMNKDGLKNTSPIVNHDIGIDEHLGDKVDLSLPFTNELGEEVPLGTYFTDKPVFMMLIYYRCPTLCNTHLNQLMQTLKEHEYTIGNQYEFVVVSIDPNEKAKLASDKLDAYLEMYGKPETRDGWHFLTGSQESIDKLTKQIGFKYAWDPREEQWLHGAASYVLTPQGKISYYHYGIDVDPKIFKLSLIEASENKIGTIVDRLVLYCLQYDPDKKTYAFYAFNVMKIGAALMAILLALFLFAFWKKEVKKQI
tara:strand:- start:7706 stop:8536 length:831 start_codon:yes stop_codon:yes gene_type:complete